MPLTDSFQLILQPRSPPPRCLPTRHFPRMANMHASIRSRKRIIQILLRILQQNLHPKLTQSILQKQRPNGREETIHLHPRVLRYRKQTGVFRPESKRDGSFLRYDVAECAAACTEEGPRRVGTECRCCAQRGSGGIVPRMRASRARRRAGRARRLVCPRGARATRARRG